MKGKKSEPPGSPPHPANDNGGCGNGAGGGGMSEPLDPRIRRIAEAVARHLAREQARLPPAVNDNHPRKRR